MTRYAILLNILDQIRAEGASTRLSARYAAGADDTETINQQRARAFIHLFLKVSFGVLDFTDREGPILKAFLRSCR